MAESDDGDQFCHASKLLSMIASISPAFENNRGAMKELEKLTRTVETIQSVLTDAEKKQQGSVAVKNWIDRVKNELENADNILCKHKEEENGTSLFKEVCFSLKLSPFVRNDSFSKEVKRIRKHLNEISENIARFKFVKCHFEHPTIGFRAGETHNFLDPRKIVGRDDDRKNIIQLLFNESNVDQQSVSVIAIANNDGTGKTTLAQLIYNDNMVQEKFQNKWWACVSFISHEKDILGKIFQSISGKSYQHDNINQLQSRVGESLSKSGKYLLVLDDILWDNNLGMWSKIMPILMTGAKGSKVIVTTRSFSVPRVMQRDKCHIYELNGLSEEESWELFQMIAFSPEQKNDPNWTNLGREIVKKCANVPLTINSIASFLCSKTSIQEWENIAKSEKLLSDSSTLKWNYDHLASKLKRCFAYCSLFPRDHTLLREKIIYLWIAQKFAKLGKDDETVEAVGNAYFMELFRRGFFQEARVDDNGDIISCKMHDIVCDLEEDVDGVKFTELTERLDQNSKKIRHASFVYEIGDSWNVPPSLLGQAKRLRSLLIVFGKSRTSPVLDQKVAMFKSLRALDLHALNLEEVPSCIEELLDLRHLNLSENTFPNLPNFITKLVKLLALDLSYCRHLESLPNDFRKLTNLRHLDISFCDKLWHMPPGFGELTSLVHLSDFKVSKRSGSDGKNGGLDALDRLNLRGKLTITYDYKGAWRRDEIMLEGGHIPKTIEVLTISDYPSTEIPCWSKDIKNDMMSNLQHLVLIRCKQVKSLPPLNLLPKLRILQLYHLQELQYVAEIKDGEALFCSLEKLELVDLPKLEGWLRVRVLEDETTEKPSFEHLSHLEIKYCHRLKSIPPSPRLQRLCLEEMRKELVQQLVETSSTLKDITINWCIELTSFQGEDLTTLRKLEILNCTSLKELKLTPNALEKITISSCPNLEMWGMDWCSFTKLQILNLDEIPEEETKLPGSLQQLRALGKLQIKKW